MARLTMVDMLRPTPTAKKGGRQQKETVAYEHVPGDTPVYVADKALTVEVFVSRDKAVAGTSAWTRNPVNGLPIVTGCRVVKADAWPHATPPFGRSNSTYYSVEVLPLIALPEVVKAFQTGLASILKACGKRAKG